MSNTIKIIVVDDHPVVRKGIVAMLETESNFSVISECNNGEEAVNKYKELNPDVILMDLVMPKMDGITAIKLIKEFDDNAKILVLTSFTSNDQVFAAIEAGATGYLLKDSDPEDLVRSIEQVNLGESSLHPVIARKLLNEFTHQTSKKKNPIDELTDREKEVLRFIAQGLSNQEISDTMVVSKATVHTHVSNILSKLQLTNRTQAALFAIREGYVPFPADGDLESDEKA